MSEKSKLLKVVLLGDTNTGKTSLMKRFVRNSFDAEIFSTIGVEFLNKNVTVNRETYTMQIWDTAGHERFKSLRTPFYRGADCCLLTFALDDMRSFKSLSMWKREFLYYADIPDGNNFPFVILGNKVDVVNRVVNEEMVRDWGNQNGICPYYETSAKDATNVDNAFQAAVERFQQLEDILDEKQPQRNTVDLSKQQKQNGCCD